MEQDIYVETARHLIDDCNLSTRFINLLAEEHNVNMISTVLNVQMSNYDKLALMLKIEGADFFSGSRANTVELRKKIIKSWGTDVIEKSFGSFCESSGNSETHKIRKLAEKNWHKGGNWPSYFMVTSNIDLLFCGQKDANVKYPDYEDVEPYRKLPQLVEYQQQLKEKLKETLAEKGDDAKSMISLPTGAGKTRIAVEAYAEFLRPRFIERKYLIWIAQSEELCEQAVASFQQVWRDKEFTESLRIYRLYGFHNLSASNMIGGIVICSINKLYLAVNNKTSEIELLIKNCGACIIDEAHRAVTSMYETFYQYSQMVRGQKMFPICGLTATPGRMDDIYKLTKFFRFNIETPTLPEKYTKNPVRYFRDEKFLARPIHKIIQTNIVYTITFDKGESEPSLEELEFEVSRGCKELANSMQRNRLILNNLCDLKDSKTLVYACNVDHAKFLAAALIAQGIKAATITANTPRYKRINFIEDFRNGDLQVLVNHSVLTTGFDAPNTNNIVICRPIFSDILYEQIVGRGLRGPRFGGTETCNIIDFTDNLGRFGDQQSYHRFADFWEP